MHKFYTVNINVDEIEKNISVYCGDATLPPLEERLNEFVAGFLKQND